MEETSDRFFGAGIVEPTRRIDVGQLRRDEDEILLCFRGLAEVVKSEMSRVEDAFDIHVESRHGWGGGILC